MAGDSPDAEGIKIMARSYQNLKWARARHTNQMRNALREYYPAAIETFDERAGRDTLAVLGRAPTPTRGARLTLPQIRAALQRGGRKRNLDKVARRIQKGLRSAHLTAPEPVADAFGTIVADQRRAADDLHHQALRALANRLVGILHGCLKHRSAYNEHTAWAHRTALDRAAA